VSVSSNCHAKNPKAETANAMMPTSSRRQFRGGNATWENCKGNHSGCVIWTATTYSHTSRPKRNIVSAMGRYEDVFFGNGCLAYEECRVS
jgi:hypothetical protein